MSLKSSHLGESFAEQIIGKSNRQTINSENLTFFQIIQNLASCTFQTVLGYICLDLMLAISLHYIQVHKGPIEDAGLGLAYTILNALLIPMGLGIYQLNYYSQQGLNQSLNVHVAQALGSDKIKLSRTYLTLTVYLHIIYFIPICLVMYFLKVPFSYTIPGDDRIPTTDAAWEYLPYLMLSSFFAIEFEAFKSYLIANEIFTPFIFIHFTTTGLHIFWCWLFIVHLDLGIKGAGIAIIISEFLNCVLLFFVIKLTSIKKAFTQFKMSFLILKNPQLTLSYIKSSWSIVIHVYLDFFGFFMLTFMALPLGTEYFNAQLAFSNTSSFYFRMPISLSLGLMTYVGGEMGNNQVAVAKRYSMAGMIMFGFFATILCILFYIFREQWARFYASEPEIFDLLIESQFLFMVGALITDGFQGSIAGTLKGIDRKNLVTYSTMIAYYILSIPLILIMTFDWGLGWKLKGIWLAFGAVNLFLCVLYVVSIFITDWDKQAEIIQSRIHDQNKLQKESLCKIVEEESDDQTFSKSQE